MQGRVEEVEGEVGRLSEQASCRIEELEQRLKSWQVSKTLTSISENLCFDNTLHNSAYYISIFPQHIPSV